MKEIKLTAKLEGDHFRCGRETCRADLYAAIRAGQIPGQQDLILAAGYKKIIHRVGWKAWVLTEHAKRHLSSGGYPKRRNAKTWALKRGEGWVEGQERRIPSDQRALVECPSCTRVQWVGQIEKSSLTAKAN